MYGILHHSLVYYWIQMLMTKRNAIAQVQCHQVLFLLVCMSAFYTYYMKHRMPSGDVWARFRATFDVSESKSVVCGPFPARALVTLLVFGACDFFRSGIAQLGNQQFNIHIQWYSINRLLEFAITLALFYELVKNIQALSSVQYIQISVSSPIVRRKRLFSSQILLQLA